MPKITADPRTGYLIQRSVLEGAILLSASFPLLLGLSDGMPEPAELDMLQLVYGGGLFAMIRYLPRLAMSGWLAVFVLPAALSSPIPSGLVMLIAVGVWRASATRAGHPVALLLRAAIARAHAVLFSAIGAPFGGLLSYKAGAYFLTQSFALGQSWGDGDRLSNGLFTAGVIAMVASVTAAGLLSFRVAWIKDLLWPRS